MTWRLGPRRVRESVDHERAADLAPALVGHADDGAHQYAGMLLANRMVRRYAACRWGSSSSMNASGRSTWGEWPQTSSTASR
jgi:hypothetical protein